jgi:peptidoglycan/LPS O-acetylase OafA/YrhL
MRLPAIDGMRGVAAIVVALFHAHEILGWQPAPGGYLAVDLFFVLSGAVIVHAYAPRLRDGMSFRSYMGRRLLRFLPMHVLGHLVGVVLAVALWTTDSKDARAPADILASVVLGLAFLPYPLTNAMFPLNVPTWSLLYEIVANAAYGRRHRACTAARLRAVAIPLGLLLLVGIVVHGHAEAGMTLRDVPLATLRTGFAFAVGGWLVQAPRPSTTHTATHPLVLSACAILPMLVPVTGVARTALDATMVLIGFPWVVRSMLALPAGESRPTAGEHTLAVMGDASFGVYALHWPLLWLWNGVARRLRVDPAFGVWVGLAALVVGCAWFERVVERPVRAHLTARWFSARS